MSKPDSAMLRVGLVGIGRFGRAWATTLAAEPGAELTWVCDPEASPAAASGLELYRNVGDAIGGTAVDVVVVATPPSTHEQVASALICAGRHVLVEKPFCVHPAEAARLVQLATRHGVVVATDHLPVFQPAFLRLQAAARDGSLGRICGVVSERLAMRRASVGACEGVVAGERCPLWVCGPHDLAMLGRVLGDAVPDLMLHERTPGDVLVHSRGSAAVEVYLSLSTTAASPRRRFAVLGSKATYVMSESGSIDIFSSPWTGSARTLSELWAAGGDLPDATPVAVSSPGALTPLQHVWRAFANSLAVPGNTSAAEALAVVTRLHELRGYPGARSA